MTLTGKKKQFDVLLQIYANAAQDKFETIGNGFDETKTLWDIAQEMLVVTEDEDKPKTLRLVSENADRDIEILHAKQQAMSLLAKLAAAVLRTIAGSPSAAPIMPIVCRLINAQARLESLSGSFLGPDEEKQALSLPQVEPSPIESEIRYREFQYAVGLEQIVYGALRRAAHQVLREREHFGGKYSTLAIEEGIKLVLRATSGPGPQKPKRKRGKRTVRL
ncbi:hypothetical protein JQ621_35110 [Bradyrhizobium manausense]|uniref:hypothetical protein n=1 Tax=Bradyrhizobium manausense TaxID=989370 RepID=UPI001BA8F4A6|nr:hypothetical protein [Bradyrhizobium manausense]MBR1092695.1 hypothetical protein [Bradyrhizobium manausense]